jgi:hypothetical protein
MRSSPLTASAFCSPVARDAARLIHMWACT